MAEGIKISEMTEVTGLLGSDLIPLVSNGANSKIQFNNLKKSLLDVMFPIGCKYVSSVNPSTWFTGTTWTFITLIHGNEDFSEPTAYPVRIGIVGLMSKQFPMVYEWTRTA